VNLTEARLYMSLRDRPLPISLPLHRSMSLSHLSLSLRRSMSLSHGTDISLADTHLCLSLYPYIGLCLSPFRWCSRLLFTPLRSSVLSLPPPRAPSQTCLRARISTMAKTPVSGFRSQCAPCSAAAGLERSWIASKDVTRSKLCVCVPGVYGFRFRV
jgi:hypothetical protein